MCRIPLNGFVSLRDLRTVGGSHHKPVTFFKEGGSEPAEIQSREVRVEMSKKLFVGNLSWGVDRDSLYQAFEPFGEIEDARVITDRDTGRSRGFGFVTFVEDDAGTKAMEEMNGKDVDGRPLRVNEAMERQERAPRRDSW